METTSFTGTLIRGSPPYARFLLILVFQTLSFESGSALICAILSTNLRLSQPASIVHS